jgi:hypothetical protein
VRFIPETPVAIVGTTAIAAQSDTFLALDAV